MTVDTKVYSKRGKRVSHRKVLISGGGLVRWANLDIGTLGALLSILYHHDGSVAPLGSQLVV